MEKFQIIPKEQYPELKVILGKRLPYSTNIFNSVQLALTGTSPVKFYCINDGLHDLSLIVALDHVRKSETDLGIPIVITSVDPTSSLTKLTFTIAKDLVDAFSPPGLGRIVFNGARDSFTPQLVHALLEKGYNLTIRPCDVFTYEGDEGHKSSENDGNYIVKPLDPNDSHFLTKSWNFVFYNSSHDFTAKEYIENNPSAGVYYKNNGPSGQEDKGQLLAGVLCYSYGMTGLLFTSPEYRGQGHGERVMKSLWKEMEGRGIKIASGVEPRNKVSKHLMAKLGLTMTHKFDHIFAE